MIGNVLEKVKNLEVNVKIWESQQFIKLNLTEWENWSRTFKALCLHGPDSWASEEWGHVCGCEEAWLTLVSLLAKNKILQQESVTQGRAKFNVPCPAFWLHLVSQYVEIPKWLE